MQPRPPRVFSSGMLFVGLWLAILAALVVFREALLPFLVAGIVAYILEPLVTRLSRRARIPRWGAVISLYLAFFCLLYVFGLVFVPQLYKEFARVITDSRSWLNALTPERTSAWVHQLEGWLNSHGIPLELSARALGDEQPGKIISLDLDKAVRDALGEVVEAVKTNALAAVAFGQRLVTNVVGFVFKTFFVLMVAAFILIDWSRIGRWLVTMVPAHRQHDFAQLLADMDEKLGGVVRGQVLICVVNGALTFVGMLVLGVKFAFLLSTLAMTLSLIPIFGTIISSVPIVLIGLTQGWQTGLGALAWIIGIHALEAYFLNPKIMGSHAKIHPVLVAFALLAGERMFGFTGALLAVPASAIALAIFEFVHARALEKQGAALNASPAALAPAPPPIEPTAPPPA